MGWDAWGRGSAPVSPQSPHGFTVTRASPCPQVQIYEVEEHKIETWRGKKREVMGAAGLSWGCCTGHGGGLHEGAGGPPLPPLSNFSPLAEVYLQGSFKPLVYISPSNR